MVGGRTAPTCQGAPLTGGTAKPLLIYHRGVRATSLDVLPAAGCGKSQLYHYFDDEADLLGAVIDRQLELVSAAQPALADIESWPTFDEWLSAILRMHDQPGGPFACPQGILAAELKNDESFRPRLDAAFGQWVALLAAGLTRMRAGGELVAEADPERLAANVIAALLGGMLLGRVRADITPMGDAVDAAQARLRRWSPSDVDHRLRPRSPKEHRHGRIAHP